ncbi:MAG: hypothetical protein NZM11_10785 [Anaerolineales bacterium]|nr:hypothetical protein [Anaerolineales bacterium]
MSALRASRACGRNNERCDTQLSSGRLFVGVVRKQAGNAPKYCAEWIACDRRAGIKLLLNVSPSPQLLQLALADVQITHTARAARYDRVVFCTLFQELRSSGISIPRRI